MAPPSAFIEKSSAFLSHPIEEGITLTDHLLKVSKLVDLLVCDTKLENKKIPYYAALLHDMGKLNPYYQYLFYSPKETRDKKKDELLNEYIGQHSIFSTWATTKLLDRIKDVDKKEKYIILCLISSHHSTLKSIIDSSSRKSKTFQNSKKKINEYLLRYIKDLGTNDEFAKLDWKNCLEEFSYPMDIQGKIPKTMDSSIIVTKFMEISLYFSALLQSDRGSFSSWNLPKFNLNIQTQNLIKSYSKLSKIRTQFQDDFKSKFNIKDDISIIQAPTGMGKTKLFLDLISATLDKNEFKKVLYFSPLLALTEDFESKIKETIGEDEMKDVLVYNHLYSGSLLQKNLNKNEISQLPSFWNFENESFNRQFVITTTQRLLMTLYSNSHSDNLKLLSLKNSLLIIDEIQVIPKFLLPNFLKVLKAMCDLVHSKVLLVSATVPAELYSAENVQPKILTLYPELAKEYHDITMKKIQFHKKFPPIPIIIIGRNLYMVNTKRKSSFLFNNLLQDPIIKQNTNLNLFYITTGIRKKTRSKIINDIKNLSECIVVSTQVIEAGVDISFDTIYREVAPLDSIIQVMGRLNREGESLDPILNVFLFDDDGRDHRPYNRLEYDESLKIIKTVSNSKDLYEKLDRYYKTISSLNNTNKELILQLEQKMASFDYPGVWEFINKEVFENDFGEPVIVPENEEDLLKINRELKSDTKSLKKLYKKIWRSNCSSSSIWPIFKKRNHSTR
jgi:CRISPR-associated endonuclease/helicase Cas3